MLCSDGSLADSGADICNSLLEHFSKVFTSPLTEFKVRDPISFFNHDALH